MPPQTRNKHSAVSPLTLFVYKPNCQNAHQYKQMSEIKNVDETWTAQCNQLTALHFKGLIKIWKSSAYAQQMLWIWGANSWPVRVVLGSYSLLDGYLILADPSAVYWPISCRWIRRSSVLVSATALEPLTLMIISSSDNVKGSFTVHSLLAADDLVHLVNVSCVLRQITHDTTFNPLNGRDVNWYVRPGWH